MSKRGKRFKDLKGDYLTDECIVKLSRHSRNAYMWRKERVYLYPLNGQDRVRVEALVSEGNVVSVLKIADSFEEYRRKV